MIFANCNICEKFLDSQMVMEQNKSKKCWYTSYERKSLKTTGPTYIKNVLNSVPFQCANSFKPLGGRLNSRGILHKIRNSLSSADSLADHLIPEPRNEPSRQPNNILFMTPRCKRCRESSIGNCSIMSISRKSNNESHL